MTALEVRVAQLEELVDKLQKLVEELRAKLGSVEHQVQSVTEVTNEIKTDTGNIVVLLKSFKLLGSIAKWAATIAGGLAGLIALLKGGKPW